MAITELELSRRLKAARENCGLTQQEVADDLGMSRTAIALIEAGKRSVNSLELEQLSRLYGRSIQEFVSESPFDEDPVTALFRAPGVQEDRSLEKELRRCATLCREATQLESLLGLEKTRRFVATYPIDLPSSRWEAIQQGRSLADQERNRLGLGVSPAWEIAETIRSQGVRVTELDMPENISGIFFHGPDIGLVIVNNRKHHRNRRLFSYAHEYCHLLVDRGRPGNVSRYENQNELIEIRANSFAAHFLMPEPGVRSFLRKLGKGEPTRQVQELFSWNQSVEAQKRAAPGSQDLQVHDVVCLAHYFGVSYDAALYHLLNLKLITKERHEELRQQSAVAKKIASILQLPNWDESVHWNLSQEILSLSFEAYRRGEISKQKVIELATEVKADKRKVAQILQVEDSENEAVDAVF